MRLIVEEGDTEADSFNRSVFCGEIKEFSWAGELLPRKHAGCGARDWRIIRPNTYPPWTRILICRNCGTRYELEIPEWERHYKEKDNV